MLKFFFPPSKKSLDTSKVQKFSLCSNLIIPNHSNSNKVTHLQENAFLYLSNGNYLNHVLSQKLDARERNVSQFFRLMNEVFQCSLKSTLSIINAQFKD